MGKQVWRHQAHSDTTGTDGLKAMDAILIPGGFGVRGTEGKIAAIQYARENKIRI